MCLKYTNYSHLVWLILQNSLKDSQQRSSPPPSPLPLDESLDHPSDGERPSDVSNYNPSDSESDDIPGPSEDRSKKLRFHETIVSGSTASELFDKMAGI